MSECIHCGMSPAPHDTIDGPMCADCLGGCIDMRSNASATADSPSDKSEGVNKESSDG